MYKVLANTRGKTFRIVQATIQTALLLVFCIPVASPHSGEASGLKSLGVMPRGTLRVRPAPAPNTPPHKWVIEIARFHISGAAQGDEYDFADEIVEKLQERPGTRSHILTSGESFNETLRPFQRPRSPGEYDCPKNEDVDVVSATEVKEGTDSVKLELKVIPIGLRHNHQKLEKTFDHCPIKDEAGSVDVCVDEMIDQAVIELAGDVDKFHNAQR